MSTRHMTDDQWARIHAVPKSVPGIWKSDETPLRRFVEGVFFVLRTGIAWADLPERFGSHHAVQRRFRRWVAVGVWTAVFAAARATARR